MFLKNKIAKKKMKSEVGKTMQHPSKYLRMFSEAIFLYGTEPIDEYRKESSVSKCEHSHIPY